MHTLAYSSVPNHLETKFSRVTSPLKESMPRARSSFCRSLICCSPLPLFVHCEYADLSLRDGELWLGRDNERMQIETPPNEYGATSIRNPVSGFLDLLSGRSGNVAPFSCARPVFDLTGAILQSASTRQVVTLPDG